VIILCKSGAPGGFSEYLLWSCQASHIKTRGWGISLNTENGDGDPCAWSLPHSQECFTICKGVDGTGNLYNSDNIIDFARAIHEHADSGVDLAVADGGFARARNLHDQEEVMIRLVVAEILVSLLVLREGGRLVVITWKCVHTYVCYIRNNL
jgi:hypothetical protein